MKIYHSIEDFPSDVNTIVTIGTFDGVHKGHQIIINRINEIAKKQALESVVLTFDPHPRHVIYPDDQELRLIHTLEEKIEALSKTGVQNLVLHKFTKEFSRTESVNFIRDFLVTKLNMKYMVVGFDHHFGKNRQGTFDNLIELSDAYGFKIEKIKPQNIGEVTISSTKIRNAILEGDCKKANTYLSANFSITGKVVQGNKIGSSIGYPTANIEIENQWKILPKNGVYAVKILLKNQQYFGMLNLGNRPSISDDSFAIEVHLFDFNATIYNEELKIEFIQRIRDEQQFLDLEKLKSQLKIDAINCKQIFNLSS
ncbi:MAG: bifunctional riboflavin kinase/FAD synthetase [Cryomorphaceae bacterium]|nr:bifunctional riboflavin kinase/FAD synthetase [Cryomorphaceae bacterium]